MGHLDKGRGDDLERLHGRTVSIGRDTRKTSCVAESIELRVFQAADQTAVRAVASS